MMASWFLSGEKKRRYVMEDELVEKIVRILKNMSTSTQGERLIQDVIYPSNFYKIAESIHELIIGKEFN
jgi:hypothetical protein